MKIVVINADNQSSARWLLELATKLHFKAHILTEEQKGNASVARIAQKDKARKRSEILNFRNEFWDFYKDFKADLSKYKFNREDLYERE